MTNQSSSLSQTADASNTDWTLRLETAKNALDNALEIKLPVTRFRPSKKQPRTVFPEEKIKEYADSMRKVGQLNPGFVRKAEDGMYEIIAGECRWRSATLAGIEYRARVLDIDDESLLYMISVIENAQRLSLTTMEMVASIDHMYSTLEMPIEVAAETHSIKKQWAEALLNLRHLHKDLHWRLDSTAPKEKRLTITDAIKISKEEYRLQPQLAERLLSGKFSNPKRAKKATYQKATWSAPATIAALRPIESAAPVPSERPMREMRPAENGWDSVGVRVGQLARMADDLKTELTSANLVRMLENASRGFPAGEVLATIRKANESLEICHKRILHAIK